MLDTMKYFYDMDYTLDGPQYLEFRYHFARCRNLFDFAVRMCNIPPKHPIADELRTHYARSNLFLLGTRSSNFKDLASYWLLSDEAEAERNLFKERQTGQFCQGTHKYGLAGSFQLMYHLFEMGALKSIVQPSFSYSQTTGSHHPCPNSFYVLLLTDLSGFSPRNKKRLNIPAGLYNCRTHSSVICPEGHFYQSILEMDGKVKNVYIAGSTLYSQCRQGNVLVIAVTLSGLPTYVLDFHRPDWCREWQALSETLFVDYFDTPRPRAMALAQRCIRYWACQNYSVQNRWASWFFHPEYGTFADEEMYDYFQSRINPE